MTIESGFNPAGKHQSQIPAMQFLVALGFAILSQAEAERQRGGRLGNVVLDELREKLKQLGVFLCVGDEEEPS